MLMAAGPVVAIEGARVFDGEKSVGVRTVLLEGGRIRGLRGDRPPADAERVDGAGCTLLPGLIDAHTHADIETLGHALHYGVTTEFDLFSFPEQMAPVRAAAAGRVDLADVRSSSVGVTAPNGHPTQLRHNQDDPELPTIAGPGEAAAFIDARIAEGSDYIKVLIEDGAVLGKSVPVVDGAVVKAAVVAAHERGLKVLAHALTVEATRQAVAAGVDGLTHLFVDGSRPADPDLVATLRAAGVFVIPTLTTLASITAQGFGAQLAADPRAGNRLPRAWMDNLVGDLDRYRDGDFDAALDAVGALYAAGVPILAGTDASHLGAPGMAHGISLHGELRLLVRAGLTPVQALRAATSGPADTFGLTDRGRIAEGLRADLLLVEGDPTTHIDDTLSIRAVWRSGVRAAR
jgi:imidazolonepropionase-like amidohydrolase